MESTHNYLLVNNYNDNKITSLVDFVRKNVLAKGHKVDRWKWKWSNLDYDSYMRYVQIQFLFDCPCGNIQHINSLCAITEDDLDTSSRQAYWVIRATNNIADHLDLHVAGEKD